MVAEIYGPPDVFELREIDKPILDDDEVLLKTYATSVNTVDIFYRSGMKVFFGLTRLMTGLRKPKKKVLGFDIAGEVVEIGKDVTEFKVGDKVYGGCRSGANAEYAKTGKDKIAMMPSNMSYSEAGVVPVAALSALQGLRDSGNIQKDQNVLIYGASGGIGTYAVQLAKIYHTKITAVSSGKNKDLVQSLGADSFIDYTKEDFTKKQEKYDLIFDTVGKMPMSKWRKSLKEHGVFVNAGSPTMSIIGMYRRMFGSKFTKKKLRTFNTQYTVSDLDFLAELSEEGKLKSVIDKSYSLEETADAHRYYELGHTAGKVVINVIGDISKINTEETN